MSEEKRNLASKHDRELSKGLQRLTHDLHEIRIKLNDACAVVDILAIEDMNRQCRRNKDAFSKRA